MGTQYYVKRELPSIVAEETRLLYITRRFPEDETPRRILHAHQDCVEVLLVVGGRGNFLIDGKGYEVEAGDLLVYNSGVVHEETACEGEALSSYCVGAGGLHLPGLRENALLPDGASPVLHPGPAAEELRQLYEMIYRSLTEDRPGCETFCHFLLLALFSQVVRLSGDDPQPPVAESESLSRKVQEYIDQHYQEPLTLQDIGKALHLSPYYLSHVFKEASGYSPMQYLLRRRIGEAQNLLISTDLPIARISEMVGYETQNYFNLQFSKHVGVPPRKFRQGFRETERKPGSGEG